MRYAVPAKGEQDGATSAQATSPEAAAARRPTVAVIIVNHRTATLAIEAVESVRRFSPDHEIHLLDNASPGGDADLLARAHAERGWGDQVLLHVERTNHGFGRGNNLIFAKLADRAVPPDHVFLLNPDARLANDAIGVLAAFLEANPTAAIAGARIKRPDGTPAVAAFRFPSLAGEFATAAALGPVSRLLSRWQVPLPPELPTSRVDWVSGAAFMCRFEAIRRHGGFDPAFFLYYEEVELMRRFARQRLAVWHVAEATVVHHEGASTGHGADRIQARRPVYWYDSWYLYFRGTHGWRYAAMAALAWLGGAALQALASAARGRPARLPRRFFSDLWARIGRPLLGLSPRSVRECKHD